MCFSPLEGHQSLKGGYFDEVGRVKYAEEPLPMCEGIAMPLSNRYLSFKTYVFLLSVILYLSVAS